MAWHMPNYNTAMSLIKLWLKNISAHCEEIFQKILNYIVSMARYLQFCIWREDLHSIHLMFSLIQAGIT